MYTCADVYTHPREGVNVRRIFWLKMKKRSWAEQRREAKKKDGRLHAQKRKTAVDSLRAAMAQCAVKGCTRPAQEQHHVVGPKVALGQLKWKHAKFKFHLVDDVVA